MRRLFAILIALTALAACSSEPVDEAPEPIGDFQLGFLVPLASENLTQGPLSRTATPEEWESAMEAAFQPRFAVFDGGTFYHLGVIVEGYVLAQPGIPVVLAPKSALIFSVTVIEDATGTELLEEREQFTVLESLDAASVLGSGLVRSKEEQMAILAQNAASRVETWMREQPWFFDAPPTVSGAAQDGGEARPETARARPEGAGNDAAARADQ